MKVSSSSASKQRGGDLNSFFFVKVKIHLMLELVAEMKEIADKESKRKERKKHRVFHFKVGMSKNVL